MDGVAQKPFHDSVIVVNGEEDHQVHEEAIDVKRSIDRDSISRKLFVGGLSWETTEESFVNYFSQYGEITDSVIMLDKYTGRPRGFGFVTFADAAVADGVLEDEHVVDGRVVEVKKTVPRDDMRGGPVVSRTKKIFVGGIPPSFTEDELREHFSSYGNVVEHQILVDSQTGRPRGFGFVTFETEDSVENIFAEGISHELGGKQVEIKKAEPRRGGSDHGTGFRQRYSGGGGGGGGGGGAELYGGYNGGAAGYCGGYSSSGGFGTKMGGGYGGYDGGYGGGYGGYTGGYGGGAAGFYGGFGFGYGGGMYGAGYEGFYGMPDTYGGGGGGGGGGGSRKGGGRGGSTTGRYNPYGR